MNLAGRILKFQSELSISAKLPKGVVVMNPYQDETAFSICKRFYKKYYSDNEPRTMILGINPGRHGGGVTGVPFTDPVKLEQLGIENEFPKKRELSADFVYLMIDAFGGPEKFYNRFYISAISPLGFTQDEKNLNYYDIKELPKLLDSFIVGCMRQQLSWGLNKKVCYCLGEGENFKFLKKLNQQHHFFEEVIPLPHPRFIMQYRRKKIDQFINLYLDRMR